MTPAAGASVRVIEAKLAELRAAAVAAQRLLPVGPAMVEVARLLDQIGELADTVGEVSDLVAGR